MAINLERIGPGTAVVVGTEVGGRFKVPHDNPKAFEGDFTALSIEEAGADPDYLHKGVFFAWIECMVERYRKGLVTRAEIESMQGVVGLVRGQSDDLRFAKWLNVCFDHAPADLPAFSRPADRRGLELLPRPPETPVWKARQPHKPELKMLEGGPDNLRKFPAPRQTTKPKPKYKSADAEAADLFGGKLEG